MGKTYKAELAAYKEYRRDPEALKRIYPKTKKLRPYKVTATLGLFNNEILIGRYATAKDAEKAMKAAEKYPWYNEIKCDPPITDEKST